MAPINIFVDGVYLKRSWGGELQNVSVLVAIGVNAEGYREILGVAEGSREDKWLIGAIPHKKLSIKNL